MSTVEETVFNAALSLPATARAHLADVLWASLPEDQLELLLEDEVRQAWTAEARQRMQDVAVGNVQLLPGHEVMERVRARLEK